MAYERQTWTCGETITADKLNHIEEGLAAGGCDCGFSCTESRQTAFDGNVTTIDKGDTYAEYLDDNTIISDSPSIVVTFNGTEYVCNQHSRTEGDALYYKYGAPYDDDTVTYDFSEYPFALFVADYGDSFYTSFITPTTGTYSFKIEVIDIVSVETTPCFKRAVESVVGEGGTSKFVVTYENGTVDHTFAEIKQAYDNGMLIEVVELASGDDYVYQLSMIESSIIKFSNVMTGGSINVYVTQLSIDNTDTVTKNAVILTA